MRVLLIVTVFLSTVVLSDYTGACGSDEGCALNPNDMTPYSCSCHVCVDTIYPEDSTELGLAPAPPFGIQARYAQFIHTWSVIAKPQVVQDGIALHTAGYAHLCPPMVDTDGYKAQNLFPEHSADFNGKVYKWQTDIGRKKKKWSASIPIVYVKSETSHVLPVNRFYSIDELLFSKERGAPHLARRGLPLYTLNDQYVPTDGKESCKATQQVALCTYCIYVIVSILCIHSLHTLWMYSLKSDFHLNMHCFRIPLPSEYRLQSVFGAIFTDLPFVPFCNLDWFHTFCLHNDSTKWMMIDVLGTISSNNQFRCIMHNRMLILSVYSPSIHSQSNLPSVLVNQWLFHVFSTYFSIWFRDADWQETRSSTNELGGQHRCSVYWNTWSLCPGHAANASLNHKYTTFQNAFATKPRISFSVCTLHWFIHHVLCHLF